MTADALSRQVWEYGPADSSVIWGKMRLVPASLPDGTDGTGGRVFGFNHPNERRWSLAGDVLTLLNDDGKPTTRFDSLTKTQDRLTWTGPHLLEHGGSHWLRAVVPVLEWSEQIPRLAIRERLTDPARPLVVIFNSMGNPLGEDGATRWEYFRFTMNPLLDYIRFAEPLAPATWYLRTDELVREALRRAASGRTRIILAGNSSGGYAAIRFGQWMADNELAAEVHTISVNPQTAHGLPHRLHLWAREWDQFLPATIDDDVLTLTGRTDVDLASLPAARCRRVARHLIFYDSDNPVECYYVRLLASRPGVQLRGLPLGMSHVRGIAEMERRHVMKTALREALDAPPSWHSCIVRRR